MIPTSRVLTGSIFDLGGGERILRMRIVAPTPRPLLHQPESASLILISPTAILMNTYSSYKYSKKLYSAPLSHAVKNAPLPRRRTNSLFNLELSVPVRLNGDHQDHQSVRRGMNCLPRMFSEDLSFDMNIRRCTEPYPFPGPGEQPVQSGRLREIPIF